jgi:hypothetical protein
MKELTEEQKQKLIEALKLLEGLKQALLSLIRK